MSGHIFLIGPMATGKTTVAARLAARLGRPMVDLDAEIALAAGADIPALFATEGEAGFRRRETAALTRVAAAPPAVVSCGGGIVLAAENRRLLRASGQVFYLWTPIPELVRRLQVGGGAKVRPVLQGDDPGVRLQAIQQQREPLYRATAHRVIATAGLDPDTVARHIERGLGRSPGCDEEGNAGMAANVRVDLGDRSYGIAIGSGVLAGLGSTLRKVMPTLDRVLVVADAGAASHWLQPALDALGKAGITAASVTVPAGERSKHLEQAAVLYDACLDARLDRGDALVALGGGATGDLGGFVAATYLRGIAFFPVPTTLLAQVDASVGGKVAVNLPRGKNLVGAFHQPRAVVADVATLATLPDREYRSGLAEVVKHAIIRDRALFQWLEENREPVLGQDSAALEHLVERDCRIKASVVSADEREGGLRAILNFGHTIGHGVEAVAGRMAGGAGLLHGEAVSVGMVAALRLSQRVGVLAQPDLPQRAEALLQAFGLPVRLPAGLDLTAAQDAMRFDKKAEGGALRWVLAVRAGQTQVTAHVRTEDVRAALEGLVTP